MLTVKIFPSDNQGCGTYRMRLPGETAAASGLVDTKVCYFDENREHDIKIYQLISLGGTWNGISHVDDPQCDVVVYQRPMDRHIVESIPHIKAHGTAVVVEVDDLFHEVHLKHPAAALRESTNLGWLERALSYADLITTSTPALAKFYGKFGPTRVVRNYVPASTVKRNTPRRDRVTFGWSGRVATHVGDLDQVGTALKAVMESCPDSTFYTVGQVEGDQPTADVFGVDAERAQVAPWMHNIRMLPSALDNITVGMVPLALSKFNEAKSYIKGLEYAARGIPFVASPTPEYEYLAKLGAGDLARTTRKWEVSLARLAVDQDYRFERADAALQAAKKLTIEDHIGEWIQAWSDARSVSQ